MTNAEFCPRTRHRRLTAFTVLVALLTALLSLTGAGAAQADDPTCAPLALAPFGDPGDAAAKTTVAPDGSVCYTVTAEAPGLHLVSLDNPSGDLYPQVFTPDGTQIDCYNAVYAANGWCDLPSAGTYTLKVLNQGWSDANTTVTVVPLASTRGCADTVGTEWDQPDAVRTSVSPVEIDCTPFTATAGDRIRLTYGSKVYGTSLAWITDATGARICPRFPEDGEDSCVLPADGTGPYRVVSRVSYGENGFPADFAVKTRRLNDPQGCTTAPVRSYGPLAGQDLTTNPCYTFTAGAAGPYTVHYVSESGESGPARVYDASGKTVCQSSTDPCKVPGAGTYTAVLDGSYPFNDTKDGLIVLDRTSSTGCVPVRTGLYKGEFTTAGQYDCLTLDAPQGASIAALTPLIASGVDADVEVLDRNGTAQCGSSALSSGTCALTGTAPYRALVHASDGATGPYGIAFYRTDAANDCPVLPAGSFSATGAKATLTTGDGTFSQCLSIPADAHTNAEVLQLVATSGTTLAKFTVLDSTGKQVCDRLPTTNGWTVCSLTPGKAHTVLFTGRDLPASYTLTRRDITATAASAGCTPTPEQKVGGPSVKGSYDAPGTLRCHQITTDAATDVVQVDVRDALGTANIAVMRGDGTTECSFRNRSCAVTGSTTHQVLVQTPATLQAAPAYHLDALRIATAAGPAPECTRIPSVAYGFGLTGTLDESHSAVCVVLPTAGSDRFDTEITDTTGAADTAVPALYNSAWANGCLLSTSGGYQCAAGGTSTAASPSLLVLGMPEKASSTSYSAKFNCWTVLCGPDRVSVTGVSPSTGVAGGKVKLTVTGTALGAGATVRLALAGKTLTATTDSVSADNRTLTATVDLTGAATGTWNVSVFTNCCEYGSGTFTVTQPTLTNTAAPKITGTAKVGAKVTAGNGSWSATPSSYTYQWKADGKAISGATASTYTIAAAQLGKKLTVTVTAAKSGWTGGTGTSTAATVAKGVAPKSTKSPVISGTSKVGKTLKTSTGSWSPTATSYGYQWYAGGKAISGATKSSLVLKSAQKGKKITVKVVAHRTGHADGSAVSKATKSVT
ncbi:PPC domain-containing protein [Streptomyces sp. NBC_01515]|uniref:Tat pathway signal protein n=1 Tax=Streptomyces sp. NBC_01515 TaxID=2903890 RepID=UPI00386D04AC